MSAKPHRRSSLTALTCGALVGGWARPAVAQAHVAAVELVVTRGPGTEQCPGDAALLARLSALGWRLAGSTPERVTVSIQAITSEPGDRQWRVTILGYGLAPEEPPMTTGSCDALFDDLASKLAYSYFPRVAQPSTLRASTPARSHIGVAVDVGALVMLGLLPGVSPGVAVSVAVAPWRWLRFAASFEAFPYAPLQSVDGPLRVSLLSGSVGVCASSGRWGRWELEACVPIHVGRLAWSRSSGTDGGDAAIAPWIAPGLRLRWMHTLWHLGLGLSVPIPVIPVRIQTTALGVSYFRQDDVGFQAELGFGFHFE